MAEAVKRVQIDAAERRAALKREFEATLRAAAEEQTAAVSAAELEAESEQSIQRILQGLIDKTVPGEVAMAVELRRQKFKAKMEGMTADDISALDKATKEAREEVRAQCLSETQEQVDAAVRAVELRVGADMKAEAEALQAKAVHDVEIATEENVTVQLQAQFKEKLAELQQKAQALKRKIELSDQMLEAVVSDEVEMARTT